MKCTVTFIFNKTSGELVKKQLVVEVADESSLLSELAKKIATSKDDQTNQTDRTISDIKILINDKYFTKDKINSSKYTKDSRFLPTYTGQALREAYPDLLWGDYIPDVLLVDDLDQSISASSPLGAYVIHMTPDGKESNSWIVPKKYLKQFALITRILSNQTKVVNWLNMSDDQKARAQEEYEKNKQISESADSGKQTEGNIIRAEKAVQDFEHTLSLASYIEELFVDLSSKLNTLDTWNKENDYIYSRADRIYGAYIHRIGLQERIKNSDNIVSNYIDAGQNLKNEGIIDSESEKRVIDEYNKKLESEEITEEGKEEIKQKIQNIEKNLKALRAFETLKTDLEYLDSAIMSLQIVQTEVFDESKYEYEPNVETLKNLLTKGKPYKRIGITKLLNQLIKYKSALIEKGLYKQIGWDPEKIGEHVVLTEDMKQLQEKISNKQILKNKQKGIETLEKFVQTIISKENVATFLASDDIELQNRMNILFQMLSGKSSFIDLGDTVLNALVNHALSHNRVLSLNYLKTVMLNSSLVDNNIDADQAYGWLKDNFNRKQNRYYFIKTKNGFELNQKTTKIISLFEDYKDTTVSTDMTPADIKTLNTIYAIDPYRSKTDGEVLRVNGYYFYKLQTKEGVKFYALKDRVSVNTPMFLSKGFKSLEEAISYASNKFSDSKLSDGIIFNRKEEINENQMIATQPDRSWAVGEIAESIDAKIGQFGVGNFTVETFFEYLEHVNQDLYDLAKSKLDTLEKVAVFKTFVDTRSGYFSQTDIDNLKKKVEEISSAKPVFYLAVQNTVFVGPTPKFGSYDTRSRYTRFRKLVEEGRKKEFSTKQDRRIVPKITSITNWLTLQALFRKSGIHLELVNSEQMYQKSGRNDAIAFHKHGIIYINTDRATQETALHEFSHLFLAMLRTDVKTQDLYYRILSNYEQAQMKYEASQPKNIGKTFSDRRKQVIESYGYKELTDENRFDILEELFADDYASYLNHSSTAFTDIFQTTTEAIAELKALSDTDDQTIIDLFNDSESKFALFNSILNGFKQTHKNLGFSHDNSAIEASETTIPEYNTSRKIMDKFIASIQETEKELTEITDEDRTGIYKKC